MTPLGRFGMTQERKFSVSKIVNLYRNKEGGQELYPALSDFNLLNEICNLAI